MVFNTPDDCEKKGGIIEYSPINGKNQCNDITNKYKRSKVERDKHLYFHVVYNEQDTCVSHVEQSNSASRNKR